MCIISAEYLEFRAATPCMYGVSSDVPYKGSPFFILPTISRMSMSISLLFSVKP